MKTFHVPTVILDIGEDIESLPEVLPINGERLAFITGRKFLDESGLWRRISSIFKNFIISRFKVAQTNPPCGVVDECREFLRKTESQMVIAIGGGSVLDVAKAAAALVGADYACLDFLLKKRELRKKGLPVIAIPTTTGTGSEVTPFTVFSYQDTKITLESEFLYPDCAVLLSPPLKFLTGDLLATTVADALCHALEAFWSRRANFVSDAFSAESLYRIISHTLKALDNGDIYHRYELLKASCLAGLAFSNTRTTGCHAISYPLTARWGIPHGQACFFTLLPIMRMNYEAISAKFDNLTRRLGFTSFSEFTESIKHISRYMGLDKRLKDYGVNKEDIEWIAEKSLSPERMANNPIELSKDKVKKILMEVW